MHLFTPQLFTYWWMLLFTGLLSLVISAPAISTSNPPQQINSLSELAGEIDRIREQSGTTGLAVAVITPHKDVWMHSSGLADVAENKKITPHTQFRLGSIAKMFVGLSVLKLVEENRLELQAPLADVAPEIAFDNPWENSHPLRVVHLLNHATGWDAPHFIEQLASPGEPMPIRQTLALHPHSRSSRWPPGTRTAYNNTGPLVAAYVVEKITGVRFEEYVKTQFLTPLEMDNSGYFYTETYRNNGATLYRGDQPLPYWHLNNRAAGGLNSSMSDMSRFVGFMIQRGKGGESPVLSTSSFEAMERPQGTLAADAGLGLTWGLGNTQFHANGIVFYGHEGSLPGANAIVAYQPALGMGYIVASNSGGPAVASVHKLLSSYLTKDVAPPLIDPERQLSAEDIALSGLYRPINPVAELSAFATRLLPWSLQVSDSGAMIKPLIGAFSRQLIAGPENSFKQQTTGKIALVKTTDPVAGDVLQYGSQTLAKVPVLNAYLPLVVLFLWLIAVVIAMLFTVIWLPRYCLGQINNAASIQLRLWPLLTVISLVIGMGCLWFIGASTHPFELAGQPSALAIMVFVSSLVFLGCSLWGANVWFRLRAEPMNAFIKWHSTLLVFLNLTVALYCLSQGVIGIRLWS